jgi:hypothetical protein
MRLLVRQEVEDEENAPHPESLNKPARGKGRVILWMG